MAKEKDKKEKDDGKLRLELGQDDSALVARSDGQIELISRELSDQPENNRNYLGDIEDLNQTFSLVLALAASLENEELYNRIFQNLNRVLMRQWDALPDEQKLDIYELRKQQQLKRNDKAREAKKGRIEDFRNRLDHDQMEQMKRKFFEDQEEIMNQMRFQEGNAFPPEMMDGPRRRKKPKMNPLHKLKNVDWNPYDKSMTAHFKDYRADDPPEDD